MQRGSGFCSLHPALLFGYFCGLFLFSMVFMHPVYLTILLTGTLLLNGFVNTGEQLKTTGKASLLMVGAVVLFNPLFNSRGATILFYFRDRAVTMEAIFYGGLFALSLLSLLFAFTAYSRVMTSDKFLYLFSSLAPKVSLHLMVTFRMLPLMKRRLQEIAAVRRTLTAGEKRSDRRKMKELMEQLSTLMNWSLENALQTAVSMRARGYELGQAAPGFRIPWETRDFFWLAYLAATGLAVLTGIWQGHGAFDVYPVPDPVFPVFSWHVAAIALFVTMPLYLEGKEVILWRFIRSRM